MKISTQWTESNEAIFDIEAEPSEIEGSLDTAYKTLAGRVKPPGFRKGKAPRAVVERYIGKEMLMEEAIKDLVPRLYSQAVEKTKIEPIDEPHFELLQVDPVSFKATIPLRPTVELNDYHQIRVDPESSEVTEDQVDTVIEHIRDQQATWEPVERPLEFGDLAIIDVEGKEDGETVLSREAYGCHMIEESESPVPGFNTELVGLEKGQDKEFMLSFPAEYEKEGLADKQIEFNVKLLEIKEKHLPELDDELARSLDQGVDTLSDLRQRITTNLEKTADERARKRFEDKVIEAVLERAEVRFPPVLVEREIDEILRTHAANFGGEEKGKEAYLRAIGKTEEEARHELHPWAANRVARFLALTQLAKDEDIKAEQSEVEAEIQAMLKSGGEENQSMAQALNTDSTRRLIEQSLIMQKAMAHLTAIASGSVEEPEDTTEAEETSSTENEATPETE